MSRFQKIDSALAIALSQIKDDIKVAPPKPVYKSPRIEKKMTRQPKIQTINGHEVQWATRGDEPGLVPFIQTSTFYVEYPTKNEDVKDVPAETARATYNEDKKCVEFYGLNKEEPFTVRQNQKFNGLPYPRFMSGLETVEELYIVDLETNDLTVELKINVLDEYSHWLLRLKEFEAQSQQKGVPRHVIEKRMNGYIKNLKATRGVDILDPQNKIPDHLLSAIEFVKQKQAVR